MRKRNRQKVSKIPKNLDRDSFSFPDDAEEQVFRADVVVAKPEGLLTAQPDDVLHPV